MCACVCSHVTSWQFHYAFMSFHLLWHLSLFPFYNLLQRIAQSLKEEQMKLQESTFSDIQLEDPTGRRNSNPGLHFQLMKPADYIYTHCHGGVYFSFFGD